LEDTRILERQNVLQTSQVLFRRLCVSLAVVLPFKDSQGGTPFLDLFDFNWRYIWRHVPAKKQTQYANHAKAFTPDQNFGPAISEAAEPASPRPALSNCRIPLAGLRRGLAGLRRGLASHRADSRCGSERRICGKPGGAGTEGASRGKPGFKRVMASAGLT
jgi:hypothetical protein